MINPAHDIRLTKLNRVLNLIPTRYRAREAELMQNKWPEYRFLTPMDATKRFHEAYRQTRSHPERASKWLTSLLERKPARVATVAMANKTARIVWAVLTRNAPYNPHTA